MPRSPTSVALCLLLAGSVAACAGPAEYVPAPRRESVAELAPRESDAYEHLASNAGPPRFARVAEGIYRGGQPSRKDLEALHQLGVRTIIDLRREDDDAWQQEQATAQSLGMRCLRYPFYGVFGADDDFLHEIVGHLRNRNVYVHCRHGRDRTSLLVALYRVLVEHWEPKLAWKLEVIDYGSQQNFFYRALRTAFDRMVSRTPAAVSRRDVGAVTGQPN
jgi:protein tyrosine/serine phosphatase